MSVTRSVLREVLRSVTGSVIRAGVISRFFTPLDSSVTQYFGIPQILSGTEITMFVYPTNGNVGLPLGAPAVTNNIFQTITFTLTANMDFIGRENTNYFDGFIADVVGGGRIYAIAENFGTTSVLIDTGGTGQNGTAQNISTDSPLFTKLPDGNWLGEESVSNGRFSSSLDWVAEGGWEIIPGAAYAHNFASSFQRLTQSLLTEVGYVYRVRGTAFDRVAGVIYLRKPRDVVISDQSFKIDTDGDFEFIVTVGSNNTELAFANTNSTADMKITDISLRQLLEVAA